MNMTPEELFEVLKKNPALKISKKDLERVENIGSGKPKGESKYHNERVEIDGYKFASKFEAERYGELVLLKMAGMIESFRVHPKYPIGGGRYYEGDFEVTYYAGKVEVEDTKGVETDVFRLKAALFREKYPDIPLIVIKREVRKYGKERDNRVHTSAAGRGSGRRNNRKTP